MDQKPNAPQNTSTEDGESGDGKFPPILRAIGIGMLVLFLWSVDKVDWSLVSAVWSAVTVAFWPPVEPRVGVVVVVVVGEGVGVCVLAGEAEELVWLSSSSTSLA